MSFKKGVSERILEGKRDMEARLARQPPADAPAPDSYGAVFTEKTLDRLRWVVPGLCIFFGLVTLLSIPHTNESAPVGLITLAWMALWIIYGLVSGSERLEVNRLTYTLTVTRYRPWGAKQRCWLFPEIAGFDLHSRQSRALRSDDSSLHIRSPGRERFWIGMRLVDGTNVDLLKTYYDCAFSSDEMSKRCTTIRAMTGKPAPRRTS